MGLFYHFAVFQSRRRVIFGEMSLNIKQIFYAKIVQSDESGEKKKKTIDMIWLVL